MPIYMTGDIHGDMWRIARLYNFCDANETTTNDWLICLGDVGLNYYGPKNKKEITLKKEMAGLPINLFCIHGNHERRPSEDTGYQLVWVRTGNIQGIMWWNPEYPNQYFAQDGYYYKIITSERELNALVCGGAYSVDKWYRLENGWHWFADEQPTEAEKKLTMMAAEDAMNVPVDIMLTHTCPTRFTPVEMFMTGIDQSKVDKSTEEFLDKVYETFPADQKPMWYFGHFHGDKYTDDYVMLFNDIIELK